MFTGNKDVDRLMLSKLDTDRDVLNACSVNKYARYICNEDFFRNRIISKYPKSVPFKNTEKWKEYYLNVVYYKDKMKEKGFSFTDGNAELYYKIFQEKDSFIRVIDSLTNGFLDLLAYLIDDEKFKFDDPRLDDNMLMAMAAEKGHKNIVDYFIGKGANNYNQALAFAIRGGHRELVDLFLSKGANNWNNGLFAAAEKGNKELIIYFIKKGGTKNVALKGAASGGKLNLVEFFIAEGANDIDSALMFAVRGFEEHEMESAKVISYLIRQGADITLGLFEAIKLEIPKLVDYFEEILQILENREVQEELNIFF